MSQLPYIKQVPHLTQLHLILHTQTSTAPIPVALHVHKISKPIRFPIDDHFFQTLSMSYIPLQPFRRETYS